jgi:CMP-N,N'-diacetyllegionaminic acid synthase
MKLLIVIPARAGSKRLPGKNVKELAGQPLINWTIELAKKLPYEKRILVSTDSQEIAEIARKCGAETPWSRPPEISKDSSKTSDVAIHALNWFEQNVSKVDGLLLLQPTTPFRTIEKMIEGIEMFKSSGMKPVVAVSPVSQDPKWIFRVENNELVPFLSGGKNYSKGQDSKKLYVVNGNFYLIAPQDLREQETFFPKSTQPLVIDSITECLDIDTHDDFEIANFFAKKILNSNS